MSARTRKEFAARQPRKPMRFAIRFKIGNRFGKACRYSLVEVCVHIVDKYAIREREAARIVTLQPGETFANEDMRITRLP